VESEISPEHEFADQLRKAINQLHPLKAGIGLATFNDTHSHSEVLAVWDKAIENASA
jgi:hypothetical protein